jgi:hypothetical protein
VLFPVNSNYRIFASPYLVKHFNADFYLLE